jgi:TRAP transporter 4TM/12TM fusion protein
MSERVLTGKMRILIEILAIVTTLFALHVIALGPVLGFLRISAIFMLLILVMTFLVYPGRRKWVKVHSVDIAFIVLSVLSMGYIIFNYEYIAFTRIEEVTPLTLTELVLGIIAIIVIAEASRRVIGIPMVIIIIALMLYALFGGRLPKPLTHYSYSLEWLVEKIYLTTKGIFGLPLSVVILLAFAFILYGVVLEQTGVVKTFIDFAYRIFGRMRGAPARAAIAAGMLMGTASGLPMSTTYIIGTPTIPEMIKVGFKPHIAGAIAAVIGTGAQIMPPILGVAAFVVAQLMGIHYIEVAKMCLISALLYFISFYIIVYQEILRNNIGKIAYTPVSFVKILKEGFYIFLISLAILIALLVRYYPEGLSALYASLVALLLAFMKKENRNLKTIYKILVRTGLLMVYVAIACASAGIIIALFVETGLSIKFAGGVMVLGYQNLWLALVLAAITIMILGMGMPSIPAYITGAALFVPIFSKLGLPTYAAHIFCYYYAILYAITPPVAFATYAGAQLAKADMMKTGLHAMRLGLSLYLIPFFFIFRPQLLLMFTEPMSFLTTTITTLIAILLISLGLGGYFIKPLNLGIRILLILSGLIMIPPDTTLTMTGMILGLVLLLITYIRAK